MLHVVNGDATAPKIRPLGGRVLVWRDLLSEGPVPNGLSSEADWEARAAWWSEEGVPREAFLEDVRAALRGLPGDEEVALWFDDDLPCQVNLLFLVQHLSAGARVRVAAPRHGEPEPEDTLRARLERAAPLSADERTAMARAWRAYASPTPTRGEDLPGPWRDLLARHLARLPDAADGLGALERTVLSSLREGPLDVAAILRRVNGGAGAGPYGVTDLGLARVLRDLSRGPAPLVIAEEAGARLTSEGEATLAGARDDVRARGVDRWVGGVRLEGRGPVWRWDAARGALAWG